MYPKILSIGFAVPEHSYSQEEIFHRLGYPRGYLRLFNDNGIKRRYFWVDLERIPELSFQEQQTEYLKGAIALSGQAIEQCLDSRSADQVGCLTFCSCTGFSPGPVIPHYLARNLQFGPNTYYCNIGSHGCEGGYHGLRRAVDFTTNKRTATLVVSCELSSCAIYPEPDGIPDFTNDLELMRANAVFGDAASCALIGYDADWRHPSIIDMETYTNTDYIDQLGFTWQNGRLRVRLSRAIPEIALKVLQPAVESLLSRNKLTLPDIRWFVIHAAGKSIIDNIRDTLKIPEEKTLLSRATLRDFGNTSSTSVGITGKMLMSRDIQPDDYAIILSIGPGVTGGATLLRFGTY